MGLRSKSLEEAVQMVFESRGLGGDREFDDLWQDAPESDYQEFLARMADELDVRFDDAANEWCGVHHDGLSCFVVQQDGDSDEDVANAIRHYTSLPPTGEGHYTIGAVRVVEKLHDDGWGSWYLLECEDYGIE